eukprot:scaffold1954_cov268-Pinguiococcus_pyrenoidosus.AAC.37
MRQVELPAWREGHLPARSGACRQRKLQEAGLERERETKRECEYTSKPMVEGSVSSEQRTNLDACRMAVLLRRPGRPGSAGRPGRPGRPGRVTYA